MINYKTIASKKSTVKKSWYIMDAKECILGRLSSKVAHILRGKHKPSFSPHVDCGDNIIIINAEKVKLTGKKSTDKQYIRYTGYPGGQKSQNPNEILQKYPEKIIEYAVKGMLPKNRLGRSIFHNMYVYSGSKHPHDGQKPITISL